MENFVVRRKSTGEYVASIDTYDGETEWTSDRRRALIFQGPAWAEIWARDDLEFVPAQES